MQSNIKFTTVLLAGLRGIRHSSRLRLLHISQRFSDSFIFMKRKKPQLVCFLFKIRPRQCAMCLLEHF